MTREEATERLKAILEEATADEDAVCYVTSDDADALDTAIKALEQIDKIEKEINTPNRGTCDYFIVDRIEEIIDKYKAESDGEV